MVLPVALLCRSPLRWPGIQVKLGPAVPEARFGLKGVAVNLVSDRDRHHLDAIQRPRSKFAGPFGIQISSGFTLSGFPRCRGCGVQQWICFPCVFFVFCFFFYNGMLLYTNQSKRMAGPAPRPNGLFVPGYCFKVKQPQEHSCRGNTSQSHSLVAWSQPSYRE